jgi:hypothetical protein
MIRVISTVFLILMTHVVAASSEPSPANATSRCGLFSFLPVAGGSFEDLRAQAGRSLQERAIEAAAVDAALAHWDALRPAVSLAEMQRVADMALPCARDGHASLALFVATVGLLCDDPSELAAFAREWFHSAAAAAQPVASLGKAVLLERRGDREGARREIALGNHQNLTEVGRRAGLLYLSGTFVVPDDQEGARWVKETADRGDWRSQRLMARLYATGRGVTKDELAAEKYVKLAVENPLAEHGAPAKQVIKNPRVLPPVEQ